MRRQSIPLRRRTYLSGLGAGALAVLGGCATGTGSRGTTQEFDPEAEGNRTATPTGTTGRNRTVPTLEDVPALSGELVIYLGRGEGGLYRDLVEHLESERYPDLSVSVRRDSSASLANTIIEEEKGGSSPADVFWSIDAGALGAVAERGLTASLPSDVTGLVPSQFRDPKRRWVGISGRARAVPYNTDRFDESDIPDDILAFPEEEAFDDALGWAPRYGAFQAFVTAMRFVHGEQTTRRWLRGMLESGVTAYPGEFLVTNAVAEGELGAGLANHYYALRLKEAKPDAPLELAFTSNDAGALVNASGVAVLASSDRKPLAVDFIRHLLTREVQRFLAEQAYEYPLVPGIDPPGSLPPIAELDPPQFDLTRLANVEATLRMLRTEGVL
ncbi:MAG: iron ABC transporter substrate-binding protein [Halodesulfurarchaeum sp.]